MMKIKIRHLILFLLIITVIFKAEVILNTYLLLFSFIKMLFVDFSWTVNQLNLTLLDYFSASIFLVFIFLFTLLRGSKFKLFVSRLNFTSIILVCLALIFILAPILSPANPDFQKNIGVTRLLSPFSSVKTIRLSENKNITSNKERFINLKNSVVKRSFDANLIFADSLIIKGNSLIYFQKNEKFEIPLNKVKESGNRLYLLGTDEFGRDILSRLIYGARISLFVGMGAVIVAFVIGVGLGFFAGYSAGFLGSLVNRFTDMFLAFPIVFLIILILAFFGNSLVTVILVLGLSGWMSLFKIVRSEVLSIKNKDYFISARMAGLSPYNLLMKEILPVILTPVVVNLVFQYGNVILAESALSYLGLGTASMYPSWGAMIDSGQQYLSQGWWMIFFPGFALLITLYTANNLGREINIKLNPRLKT